MRIILWVLVGMVAVGVIVLLWQSAAPAAGRRADVHGNHRRAVHADGASGKPFSSAELNGKPAAIFFGFTHCPDVCPTTLARLVKLRRQLGKGDDALSIVFISVDPERDGPAEVDSYAKLFESPVIGLTGTPAQIEQVKKQFGIYSQEGRAAGRRLQRRPYRRRVILMDRNGQFVATLSPEEGEPVALDKLKRISRLGFRSRAITRSSSRSIAACASGSSRLGV